MVELVLEEAHVEDFVEKASRLVRIGEMDPDECCWLLASFAHDLMYSGEADTFFSSSCLTCSSVVLVCIPLMTNSLDGAQMMGGVALFPCKSTGELCSSSP